MTLEQLVETIALIVEGFEGCRLKAYRDVVGIWTIGFGETLGVKEGDVWTLEYAKRRLRVRIRQFLLATLTKCPQLRFEPSGRVAACTSLAYNIGVSAFGVSSVCRHTLRKAYLAAARAFLLWNKAGGRVVRGLDNRRRLEMKMYLEARND